MCSGWSWVPLHSCSCKLVGCIQISSVFEEEGCKLVTSIKSYGSFGRVSLQWFGNQGNCFPVYLLGGDRQCEHCGDVSIVVIDSVSIVVSVVTLSSNPGFTFQFLSWSFWDFWILPHSFAFFFKAVRQNLEQKAWVKFKASIVEWAYVVSCNTIVEVVGWHVEQS